MSRAEIRGVADVWCEESARLGAPPYINAVQIFENRGSVMGASNPHPHCQIWAQQTLPNELRKELDSQLQYQRQHRRCLLCDYLARETSDSERLIVANGSFAVVVPLGGSALETLVIGSGTPARWRT